MSESEDESLEELRSSLLTDGDAHVRGMTDARWTAAGEWLFSRGVEDDVAWNRANACCRSPALKTLLWVIVAVDGVRDRTGAIHRLISREVCNYVSVYPPLNLDVGCRP